MAAHAGLHGGGVGVDPGEVLFAVGGVDDRIEGLQSGGDDYLVKPFVFDTAPFKLLDNETTDIIARQIGNTPSNINRYAAFI